MWLCFIKTTRPATFLAQMAQQIIRRHTRDAKKQVHLHLSDTHCRCHSRRHLCPARHTPYPGTNPEHKNPKLLICWPDMHIHIQLFAVLKFSILMHLLRIARTIQILIQICWLIMEHALVCTLSVVWSCSKHLLWKSEQPIEPTCKLLQALIERHGILEIIIIYFYVLFKNNIVIKKNVNGNVRKAAKTMGMLDYTKSNDCILWTHPWQNAHQRSVNHFRSCKSGN